MKKKIIYQVRPTVIVDELRRREEQRLNELQIMGFDQMEIEQMQFEQKYHLDIPTNPLLSKLTQVLTVIFSFSDRIHNDVLYDVGKGIIDINLQDIISHETDDVDIMEIADQVIIDVVVKKMERLYYFHEDEVFSSLVFDLCHLLDLNAEDYGFNKNGHHETD